MTPANRIPFQPQEGAALIVSMVMLVVMTLIGVVAMSGSHLEWLMTNNSQLQSSAYRNAIVAMQAGLNDPAIPSSPNPPPPGAQSLSPPGGLLAPSNLSDPSKWSDGTVASNAVVNAQCTATCKYIVEYLGCSVFSPPPPSPAPQLAVPSADACNADPNDISMHTYRVWAYGNDGKGAARILQMVVRRTYNVGTAPPAMKPPLYSNWTETL